MKSVFLLYRLFCMFFFVPGSFLKNVILVLERSMFSLCSVFTILLRPP